MKLFPHTELAVTICIRLPIGLGEKLMLPAELTTTTSAARAAGRRVRTISDYLGSHRRVCCGLWKPIIAGCRRPPQHDPYGAWRRFLGRPGISSSTLLRIHAWGLPFDLARPRSAAARFQLQSALQQLRMLTNHRFCLIPASAVPLTLHSTQAPFRGLSLRCAFAPCFFSGPTPAGRSVDRTQRSARRISS